MHVTSKIKFKHLCTFNKNIHLLMKMNLAQMIDFNRYVYIACRRVQPAQELNPRTSLLSGQLVRPRRPSPPNMQYITKAKKFYSSQFDWNSKNYCLTEIKIQQRIIQESIKWKEMSVYLRNFSQNQLAVFNQFINENEFRSNHRFFNRYIYISFFLK